MGALAVVALILVGVIARDVFFGTGAGSGTVRTATVTRGTVSTVVTGTGTVVPIQQQNVSFREAGVLSEVDVKVGDTVAPGQVLARIDTTTLEGAVNQAQAQLSSAQAGLSSAESSNAVSQAQHNLASAQVAYNDAVASANLTNGQDAQAVTSAQNAYNQCATPTPPQTVAQCQSQQLTAIQNAQNKQALDQVAGQRSIHQAQASIQTAQDSVNASSNTRPSSVAQAQAAVAQAQAGLTVAQQNLAEATLTAPFGGTVGSINGVVGESVSPGGGTTATSPGSLAPEPSGSGATSSTSTGSGTTAAGGPFMVLANNSSIQVVAPLAEGDAARVQANQAVAVTVDAVTGLNLQGHVVAVAPQSSVISNVSNYYVTLALDQGDARLHQGMTANASITVNQVADALAVPNAAITRIGQAAYVTLLKGNNQTRVPVTLGATGDSSTQITAGLQEGDRVVLPTFRLPTSGTTGAATGRGGGGGGAVRVGG